MKHILRKLHIGGGGGGGHEPFDGRNPAIAVHQDPSSSSSAAASATTSSGFSGWLTNARHSFRPSSSSSSSSSSANSNPSPSNSTGSQGRIEGTSQTRLTAEEPGNFNYYEEEYQVQLALALSMSSQNEVDDPESFQIRAAKRISLGRPPSPRGAPAQSTAHRYWNYNVLDYGEKVVDGFYDVYGVVSDFGTTDKMPSLVHLQNTPSTGVLGYEVVLVNRAIDPDLVHLEQAALCLALDCGMSGISPQSSDLAQNIADLVVQHMGGPVVDANDIHRRWVSKSYELRTSLNNIVLPLGSLKIGMSRHRALLFKVLADHVGIPCRLVKGSHYTGTDEGAVNIIKLESEREYIIDLMGAPGTLLPAEIVGTATNIDLFENAALVEELFSQIDKAQNLLIGGHRPKSSSDLYNRECRAKLANDTMVTSNGHQEKGILFLSGESGNTMQYLDAASETSIISAGKSTSKFSDCYSAVDSPLLPCATGDTSVANMSSSNNKEWGMHRNLIQNMHGEDEAEIQMQNIHERLRKRRVNENGDTVVEDVAGWEIPWEEIEIGMRIGLGSYGEVHHGDWRGMEVAVKKFLDQDFLGDALDEFISEVRIMRRMQHPNVVLFVGAVTRPPNLSIVTEYLPRGSLFRLLHRPNCQLDEKLRLKMALDVVEGMNYLHTSKPIIVHRDLKSPNLLVDKNWVVKVCDFGLSRLKHHTFLSTKSTAGTPEWMAPEVLRNEPSNEKCDVYSFGVILWELCTLQQPWNGMNPMQVVGAVGFQNRRLDIPNNVDPCVSRIISSCWQSEPTLRPSFSELMVVLKPLERLLKDD